MNLKKLNKLKSQKYYKLYWILWGAVMIAYFGSNLIFEEDEPPNPENPYERYFGYTFVIVLSVCMVIAIPIMMIIKFKVQWHKDLENPDYAIQVAMQNFDHERGTR